MRSIHMPPSRDKEPSPMTTHHPYKQFLINPLSNHPRHLMHPMLVNSRWPSHSQLLHRLGKTLRPFIQHYANVFIRRSRQGAQVVAELFRRIASIQNAQENEVKRRLAWEKEQEEKGAQKTVEMEQKMAEMYEELMKLRSDYGSNQLPPLGLLTPQDTMSPETPQQTNPNPEPASPISPSIQPSQYTGPAFVQGSSSAPLNNVHTNVVSPDSIPVNATHQSSPSPVQTESEPIPATEPTTRVISTPIPSPHLVTAETPRSPPRSAARSAKRKKKRRKSYDSDEDEEESSGTSASSRPPRPRKRTNHHDTTCYTIHVRLIIFS